MTFVYVLYILPLGVTSHTQVATLNVNMTLKSETSSVATNIRSFILYLNIYSFNKCIISLTDIYSFLGRQKSHVFKLSYNAMDSYNYQETSKEHHLYNDKVPSYKYLQC